jgi:diguanylate cyclase (GGDEF)-like protein/PAS domain S-box-containing protein
MKPSALSRLSSDSPLSIAPELCLAEAARQMTGARCSAALVSEHDQAIGIVTEHDLVHAAHRQPPPDIAVRDIMSQPLRSLTPQANLRQAHACLIAHGIRHLPLLNAAGQAPAMLDAAALHRALQPLLTDAPGSLAAAINRLAPRLPATAELRQALQLMALCHASCVVVCDGQRPLGLLSERLIAQQYAAGTLNPQARLDTLMRAPTPSIRLHAPLHEAGQQLLEQDLRHLLVLDEEANFAGLLTAHELLRSLPQPVVASADQADGRARAHDADDLTRRQALLERLRRSEQNLRHAQAVARLGSWHLDFKRDELSLSDESYRILALPLQHPLSYQDFLQSVHKDDLAAVKQAWQAARQGASHNIEHRIIANGEIRWVHAQAELIRDKRGQLDHAIGAIQDITEQKQTAAQLQESEANFRAFFNSINDFAFILDDTGKIIHINAPVTARLCYAEQELRGQPVLMVHPAERRDEAARIVGEMLSGQTQFCPVPLIGKQGQLIPVETRVVSGQWNGKPALFGLSRDMSQMVASEEKFSSTFQLSPVAMAISSLEDGKFIDINQAFAEVTGYAVEETIGHTSRQLKLFVDPDLRAKVVAMINQRQSVRNVEIQIRTKSGAIRYGLFSAGALLLQSRQLLLTQMLDISERKAAESTLHQERTLLRTLINTLPQLIWLKDTAGKYLACNQRFEKLYNHLEADIIGRDDYDFVTREVADFFREHDRKAIAANRPSSNEEWLTFASNGYRGLFETVKTPMFDAAGQLLGVLGIARDITAEREAQARLRESELRFRAVVSQMTDSLSLIDREGNLLFVNQQAATCLAGGAAEEIQGRNMREFLATAEAETSLARYRQVIDHEQPFVGELRMHLHDGEHWLLTRLTPIRLTDDGSVDVLSIALDVTERKRAQDTLQAERDLFAGGPVAVLVWRTESGWPITYASANVEPILGYSSAQLTAPEFRFLTCLHPDDIERISHEMQGYLQTNRTTWEQRYRVIHPDGSAHWLYDYSVAERDASGEIRLIRGYVMDITEQVMAEERLRLAACVFEYAHEGIMICDAQVKMLDVNPTFSDITGFTAAEVLGRNPRILSSGLHPTNFYRDMWQTILKQNHWRGEIWNRRKDGSFYAALMTISLIRSPTGEPTHYLGVFSDITLLKSHQEKLELLAHYDPLTRLPNRVLLADRMHQAMAHANRQHNMLAICYLDLDSFKPVNDRYGHDTGDLLLMEIARRLQAATRADDSIARLGGDEFVLLLSEIHHLDECRKIIIRVLNSLASPCWINGHELQVSGSIGITLFPDDNADADTLLRHADQAMYQAKLAGRNRYHLFDPRHNAQLKSQQEALADIEQGLKEQQFALHYQPKVNMRLGCVVGLEALIRWRHPQRGMLSPASFLPLLEGHALGITLDWWVLEHALRQMQSWSAADLHYPVSINLSGSTLLQQGFIERLQALLKRYPSISPTQLELEVLETAALEDMESAGEVFRKCQALGLQIALDDFGTGYSSLTYFKRLPANTLKIDQIFIRDMLEDPDDMAIVESVVNLTKAFNRQVIAEGMENTAIGAMLLHLGCDIAQGYGIARPMAPDKLPHWLAAYQPDPNWQEGLGWHTSSETLPLSLAGPEHKRWVADLVRYITNTSEKKMYASLNTLSWQCRFGHWYAGSGQAKYGELEEFRAMRATHDEVHRIGQELLNLRNIGEREKAREGIPLLLDQSKQLMQQLQALLLVVAAHDP